MIDVIAKILTLLCLPFLAVGFGSEIVTISESFGDHKHSLAAFLAGFALFAVFWRFIKRYLQVICTFEHEFTHLIFGLLFLKVPRSFVVTWHEGGYVEMNGGNYVITLAPYFFPTVSYLLLPLAYITPKPAIPIFYGVLGASVSFHLLSTWLELHWKQTDLHKAGLLFSISFLPVANLIFYGALMAFLFGEGRVFGQFWVNGAAGTLKAFYRLFGS